MPQGAGPVPHRPLVFGASALVLCPARSRRVLDSGIFLPQGAPSLHIAHCTLHIALVCLEEEERAGGDADSPCSQLPGQAFVEE